MSRHRFENRRHLHHGAPRLARIAALAAWLSLALPHVVRPETPASSEGQAAPAHRVSPGTLESVVQALEAELQLAQSRSYYFVVDADPQRLRLMQHGVLLHEVPVTSVEIGTPRWLFTRRSDPADAFDRIWLAGRLDPERVRTRTEIDTSPDSADVPIPPLPEELYPTPGTFWVHFDGGLALEVVPDSTGGSSRHQGRVSELFASIRGRDRWRVRLELDPGEVGRLYRSLPDSCAFLLVSTPSRKGGR